MTTLTEVRTYLDHIETNIRSIREVLALPEASQEGTAVLEGLLEIRTTVVAAVSWYEAESSPVTIKAKAHSDDRVYEVDFDAEPYFRNANAEAILQLAKCGWGGDYPADNVVLYVAEKSLNDNVVAMFGYLERKNKTADVGFECRVDRESAMRWLKDRMPLLHAAILRQEGD